MTSAPAIELDGVRKSFDGGRSFAVDGVSLAVETGAFVAMIGSSGAGKTTALKLINRLIEPDDGTVRIDGEPANAVAPATLRRRIGYVFQGVGLFPHMSVAENIGITPRLLGWPADAIASRVAEVLDLVGLPRAWLSRSPDQLSGGERQRVGIARAIAARPRIMLMDEPFGALDPVTRDGIGAAYRALHDRIGLTTLMVTHDVQEAVLFADRIAVLRDGRLAAYDTPQALMSGVADAGVAALLDMPRRRAERVRVVVEGGTRHG